MLSLLVAFSGCSMFAKRPSISGGGFSVVGPADAGKPATLDSGASVATLPLPAGSTLVMTKSEATKAIPATDQTPAVAAQPAKEVVEVKLAGPTEWRKTESTVKADTGTVDTSVATHRIDVEERRWLLFAAIGCGIAGLICKASFPAWPSISNGLLMAAVAAGAAWKLSDIPAWLWAVVIGVSVLLVMGYKRREKDEREAAAALATK